ncbi:hypothetical protein TNIN_34381 [Trichonephila inaurata madagascariensis]|uniref:Uncharacterized protein n=1 Tax=Trichonephila inaurata madagascariensis TaxID=2747483 RepID=A0A8X7BTC1_9ARAC|nr:hypothetical protein TNIN_97821 [Trichonephila inaurata madagascariensis]GFY41314.1 hypothetical protein TNIN_34381 [Trichonephila inaurata madagascariensis]
MIPQKELTSTIKNFNAEISREGARTTPHAFYISKSRCSSNLRMHFSLYAANTWKSIWEKMFQTFQFANILNPFRARIVYRGFRSMKNTRNLHGCRIIEDSKTYFFFSFPALVVRLRKNSETDRSRFRG